MNKLYAFRLKGYNEHDEKIVDTLVDFMYSELWNREVVIRQISRLYPDCYRLELCDGASSHGWTNTEVGIQYICDKLNNIQS